MTHKRLAIWIGMWLLLAACSDSSLADLGSRSSEWIGERVGGSSDVDVEAPPFVAPTEVDWVNDGLGRPGPSADSASVVAAVAARATQAEAYVQASRYEVAVAVPGMVFPAVLPPEVVGVTSQLVVAPGADRLDDTVKAAFGLWLVEPYTRSRSVGQRGTFVIATPSSEPACERLSAGAVGSCTFTDVDGREIVRIDDESGQTWVWEDEQYEYQLFLRGSLENNAAAAEQMLAEPRPFTEIAPTPGVTATPEATADDQ